MRVEELMSTPVQSIRSDESLERAAQLMWEWDCGSIPVCTGDGVTRVVGMITDRDICMCAYIQGRTLRELKVSDAIADQKLRVCRASDSVTEAESAMRQGRVRRLPVVDSQGALVGMLSIADLSREASRQQKSSERQITETDVNDTLAAICTATAASSSRESGRRANPLA